ncbi:MAG: hypothetical protein LBE91_17205 [Tannerella sp.]|jgi:hypothetical protein|nr:hypothetical protein [Tannerella sp.]
MKKFVFLLMLFNLGGIMAQNRSPITPTIAKKVSIWCRFKSNYTKYDYAGFLCYRCLQERGFRGSGEIDRIIYTLDKHLDYTEDIIYEIYKYHPDGFFSYVKDYFTIEEIDIMQDYAEKRYAITEQQKKQQAQQREIEAKQKAEQDKSKIRNRIENNELFTSSELSKPAEITIDMEDLATYINSQYTGDRYEQNPINYTLDVIVSRNRELSLKNSGDRSYLSDSEQLIYQYLKELPTENIHPAMLKLQYSGETVNVNSVIHLQFNETVHSDIVTIDIEKNKKTKQWLIKDEPKVQGQFNQIIRKNEDDSYYHADDFFVEFEDLLYSDRAFSSIKKGRYRTQFKIIDHRILCTVNNNMLGEGKLNYSFGVAPPKKIRNKTGIYVLIGLGVATLVVLDAYESQNGN